MPKYRSVFLKWFLRSFSFLLTIGSITALTSQFTNIYVLDGLIAIVTGSVVLAGLFSCIQIKYIPRRKLKLMDRIIDLYGAYPVDEYTTRFRIGAFDVYTELNFDLKLWHPQDFIELISFHIPREQIFRLPFQPDLSYRMAFCDGIETFIVYETNGMGLKKAKKILEKKLGYERNMKWV